MTVRLITPPAQLAVSMDAARRAARVDVETDGTSIFDDDLTVAIQTYTAAAELITARSFINRTYRVTLDKFPAAIKLPSPPLVSVSSVNFYDVDGVQQTLDPQDYIVDSTSEPGYVVPEVGKAWPETDQRINAVTVECLCGYGSSESSVPAAVKRYVLARIQQQFAPVPNANPENFDSLLDALRVYG